MHSNAMLFITGHSVLSNIVIQAQNNAFFIPQCVWKIQPRFSLHNLVYPMLSRGKLSALVE